MASHPLPGESDFSHLATVITDSPSDAISPSQPLPAENPSHSRVNSKDAISPKTVAPPAPEPAKQFKPPVVRGKSNSLSFPILVKNATSSQATDPSPAATSGPSRPKSSLRIHVPQTSETGFLTSLAAQERQVLELKEELKKAEASLSKLKSQWASHESRRRETESRRLHRMKSLSGDAPVSTQPSSIGTGTTTPREMFEQIQRQKASLDQTKPSSRRRRFSGSRNMRALSLVSPDALVKLAEQQQPSSQSLSRVSVDKQGHSQSPGLIDSPNHTPPTPDLVHEEDEEGTDAASSSQRSSQSPRQPNHIVRSSMQMAVDFREGLWTFFDDLKQATYGDEVRNTEIRPRGSSRSDVQTRREMRPRSSRDQLGKQKRTVKRQTWQIRPQESQETLIDVGGPQYKVPIRQEVQRQEQPSTLSRQMTAPEETPRRSPLYDKEVDGEIWQTWDTPQGPSRATTPGPPPSSRKSSLDSKQTLMHAENGRKGSLPWPALNKLRPGQFTRTTAALMEEWQRSLNPPPTFEQMRQLQHEEENGRLSPRPVSPLPLTKRANSRIHNYS